MTNTETLPPIDPQITDAADAMLTNAVAVGSAGDLTAMLDRVDDVIAAATALREALSIETQGGAGAAEDGYLPADRPGVIATIRGHLTRIVADRLTWRDNDGHMHMLYAR
ncbi:hypothetical protein D7D52_35935 [Nocardia yunnanensis]|uniref:Uncharacterized protein n=1 Tax=Nocardia yunnanensis TaxID=2382165 RepID=A0A386ZL81_9NOCA|nr:hypothetical protein [Nocardia yunnanensis]AYF78331.1 hypothetical protein D7D52_35935 [Nocardia yunnanensis]